MPPLSLRNMQRSISHQRCGCIRSSKPSRPSSISKITILTPFKNPAAKQFSRQAATTHKRTSHPGGVKTYAAAAPALATGASPHVAFVAVIIGWLVIAGSTVRSLPQILRILKNSSVTGLSLTSFLSELLAYSITVSYNFRFRYPFSTFGDVVMCWLQNLVIIGLMFHYRKGMSKRSKIAISVGIVAGSAWLFTGACPDKLLVGLQAMSVALIAFGGRLPQIILNARRGNSGELSAASTGLSLAGNVARVFTTITLVGDPVILAGAMSQMLLNGILLLQIIQTANKVRIAALHSAYT